jgi:hypothetical protein
MGKRTRSVQLRFDTLGVEREGAWSAGDARDSYYLAVQLAPGAAVYSYTFVHT